MKKLLLTIGAILLLFLILGFLAPKTFEVERTIDILAPRGHVYDLYLNNLENLYIWSKAAPGKEMTMIEYAGQQGTLDSKASWKSKGMSGRSAITYVLPMNRLETTVRYLTPRESVNHAIFKLSRLDAGCRVTYVFKGHDPFPFNIRHLVYDEQQWLGPLIEADLLSLKRLAEASHNDLMSRIEQSLLPAERLSIIHQSKATGENLLDWEYLYELAADEQGEGMKPSGGVGIGRLFDRPVRDSVELIYFQIRGGGEPSGLRSDDLSLPRRRVVSLSRSGAWRDRSQEIGQLRRYCTEMGWTPEGRIEERFEKGPWNEADTTKWSMKIMMWVKED